MICDPVPARWMQTASYSLYWSILGQILISPAWVSCPFLTYQLLPRGRKTLARPGLHASLEWWTVWHGPPKPHRMDCKWKEGFCYQKLDGAGAAGYTTTSVHYTHLSLWKRWYLFLGTYSLYDLSLHCSLYVRYSQSNWVCLCSLGSSDMCIVYFKVLINFMIF